MADLSLAEAEAELKQVAAGLRDTSGLMRQFAVAIAADSRRNFESGSGPDGRSWAPLAYPRPGGKGGSPLRNTGALMASVVSRGAGHIEQIGAASLVFGTNRIGATLHQFGGVVRPKGHPFLAIPATVEAVQAGSPRHFPEKLSPRIGKRGGVLVSDKGGVGRVEYFLARSVRVPARPFLGFGERLLGTMTRIGEDWMSRVFRGGPQAQGVTP